MFWDNFYYKFLDKWSPPVGMFPRWFAANGYPTLADPVDVPDLNAFVVSPVASGALHFTFQESNSVLVTGTVLPSFTSASSGLFPFTWLPPYAVQQTTGSTIQAFFDVIEHEKQALKIASKSLWGAKSFYADRSEIQFGWYLTYPTPIYKLELALSDGHRVELAPATSEIDLFYGHAPTWKQVGNQILITNLDVLNNVATNLASGGFLFINYTNIWDPETLTFIQHPSSQQWIPLHPSEVREDGMLPFYYQGSINVRSRFPAAATSLSVINLYVNGESDTAQLVDLRTNMDTLGLIFGLRKLPNEPNANYFESILAASWFMGQTKDNVRSYLSTYFRTSTYNYTTPAVTSIAIPSGSSGYDMLIKKRQYVSEVEVPQFINGSYDFTSRVASPDYWCAFIDNREVALNLVDTNTYQFDTHVPFFVNNSYVNWKTTVWTASATSINFTPNWNTESSERVDVLFSSKVTVNDPSLPSQKISFNKHSPALRWQSQTIYVDEVYGSASFS